MLAAGCFFLGLQNTATTNHLKSDGAENERNRDKVLREVRVLIRAVAIKRGLGDLAKSILRMWVTAYGFLHHRGGLLQLTGRRR